jgi:murein DD-endopeptidase MepM/ murein hydrolase activator NlpD
MMHDYKNVAGSTRVRHEQKQHWHLHGALIFIVSTLLAVLISLVKTGSSEASIQKKAGESAQTGPVEAIHAHSLELESGEEMLTIGLALPPPTESAPRPLHTPTGWQPFTVKSGQNLAAICSRAGISASDVHAIMSLGKGVEALNTLYPGDKVDLQIAPDGKLMALRHESRLSKLSWAESNQNAWTKQLLIRRNGEDSRGIPVFIAETINHPLEIRAKHATGVIEYSLYHASQKAGLSYQLFDELVDLFSWDIDFTKDVHKGDRFTVVYEEYYREGEKIPDKNQKYPILVAEFINQGKSYRAVRYTDPNGETGYFTPEGASLRKAFMRNPIKFTRISSYFNTSRKHPILNTIRAHNGVDYAAKTGTPIRATGDGKVVFRGVKGGYGNTIILQHGQRYSTLYAHMSRFDPGAQVGRKIKQNDIIGYVGQSGLATGPHLHYEFRVDGQHRNPLTVRHATADPIPSELMREFISYATPLLAQLDILDRHYLALNETVELSGQ